MIKLLTVFLLIGGTFLCLGMTPTEYLRGVSEMLQGEKHLSIKQRIESVNKKRKEKAFLQLIQEVQEVLEYVDQKEMFSRLCVTSALFALIGLIISFSINNIFMIFPLSIAFAIIPFLYMKYRGIQMKKIINEELETALSIITTSYLRSEDIIKAVQENLPYMKMATIRKPFQEFVVETTLINPDIELALENLQGKINNEIFREWISILIACQSEKNLRTTLVPIVEKFSDVRMVTAEVEEMRYAPVKQFVTMCILLVAVIPLIYFVNRDWFFVLVNTLSGKGILAVTVAVIVFSVSGVIKVSKPVEYRR